MRLQTEIPAPQAAKALRHQIEEYYDRCWTERFLRGHNADSLAIHLGYYLEPGEPSETAKNRMNEIIAREFGLDFGQQKTLVDAGCGVGGTSLYLGRSFPRLRVRGFNISLGQIEFARQRVNESGMSDRVEFWHRDY